MMTRKHAHTPDRPEPPKKAAEPTTMPPAAEPVKGTETRECRDLVDQLQRLAAEYANYQKRTDRQLAEEHQHGAGRLALDILPAIDNLERALAADQAGVNPEAWLKGARVAHEELLAALRKHGVMPIEAVGRPFDPHVHEAVAHVPSEDQPEGRVLEESRKGYRMGDRTIRASRVAVSRGPVREPTPEQGESKPENEQNERPATDEAKEPYADV